MEIGLALSGGGFRATVFHLGMLARLAKENQLENVSLISSVSGGSLCIGLVYAVNQFRFPTSCEFIEQVVPRARELLMTQDLQTDLIWRVIRSPFSFFETRADDLSTLMQQRWGLTAKMQDLPAHPRWLINTTCYETCKDFRFERGWMGDYVFGYTRDMNFPVSDAVAASAGFPGLIGPLTFDASKRKWFNYEHSDDHTQVAMDAVHATVIAKSQPIFPTVHLWDGGVYDNLGLEGVMDPTNGWRKNIEFLIASDASGNAKLEEYRPRAWALYRIISGVMLNQIRMLRSRMVIERLVNHHDPGVFVQMGNTFSQVAQSAKQAAMDATLAQRYLNESQAKLAANFDTTIRKLTHEEFELIFRHGFEVADYTLFAYHPDQFKLQSYDAAQWKS